MDTVFRLIPFLLLLYGGWITYDAYEEHVQKLESVQSGILGSKGNLKKIENRIAEVENFIPQIDSVEKAISEFEKKIETIKFKIPPLAVKTDILDELSVEAKKLNIQNISFKPKYEKENSGGVYFTNGLQFDASGTYLQFLIFFEKLSVAERLFNVSTVSVQNVKGEQTGRHKIIKANAIIETFHYNDNYTPPQDEKDKVIIKGSK